MGTGVLSRGKAAGILKLRMSGAIPLRPVYAIMAWTGTALHLALARTSGFLPQR
jgi:hypothetical protein